MWQKNLKELRKSAGNPTCKAIAELSGLPERTVRRAFDGETDCPKADTLYKIVHALGGCLDDILADTDLIIGHKSLADLQSEYDVLAKKYEEVTSLIDEANHRIMVLEGKIECRNKLLQLHRFYEALLDINSITD